MKARKTIINLLFSILITPGVYASGNENNAKNNSEAKSQFSNYVSAEVDVLASKVFEDSHQFLGFSTIVVGNQETLTINGDLTLDERTKVLIEEGSSILVYGNLKIKGDAEVRLEGSVHVLGAMEAQGKAKVYGDGTMRVIGQSSIADKAEVFGDSNNYLDSQVFTAYDELSMSTK